MRVRMKVSLSGTRDGEPWPPRGRLADLPDREAADLMAAGLAEPPGDDGDRPETATAPEAETATAPEAETATAGRRKAPARGK
ncbi:hypothetical protein [Streptomyces sp. SID8352]|uniref:hypothetical protein n=1 Tax=Streptomyces sp. SID8352 TaxID=2690338 RepID=UPI00136CE210|nr:hypothetical protein [Streptomyces sp. SID8352]MYU24021.1 hypothetical protein [Streptomyces sp. SID8352]